MFHAYLLVGLFALGLLYALAVLGDRPAVRRARAFLEQHVMLAATLAAVFLAVVAWSLTLIGALGGLGHPGLFSAEWLLTLVAGAGALGLNLAAGSVAVQGVARLRGATRVDFASSITASLEAEAVAEAIV